MSGKAFDYIVCGGGTSGCVVASRLASQTNASVLLVEAGRDAGVAPDVLIPGKYVHQLTADLEGLWQLPTAPQKKLNNREIVFLRGKQLGGSSAVNYMALARGPAADFDDWARLTGDEGWKWDNILPLMKELEDFRQERPHGFKEYANPDPQYHGCGGPIKVGFGDVMTPGVPKFFDACKEVGIEVCLDNNSGNPVGVGLAQFNTGAGERSYAATAFLGAEKQKALPNLQILTNVSVDKIIFEAKKAVGLTLFDHRTRTNFEVHCHEEVIVCQGTFGSPQLLMLSGVGPKLELNDLGIECVLENKYVGCNVLDHSILTIEYEVDDTVAAHNQIFSNPKLLAEADALYAKNKTGPHNVFGTSGSVAFPRIQRLFDSEEFKALPKHTQLSLLEKTRPSAEIWLGSGSAVYEPASSDEYCITHELLLQNNLSAGTVSLTSADPRCLPRIDPHFLEHPFDRRIAIETVRMALRISNTSAYQSTIKRMVHGPTGEDDDSILDFVRDNLGQGYHSLGSCKMGLRDVDGTVVDCDFRVLGIDNVRIADLSVCPILTCNHTQINAYLIGERCAQKLIAYHKQKDAVNLDRN